MNGNDLSTEYSSSHALIIGIDQYINQGGLGGAVNDAVALANLLQDEFRFPADQVHLLTDREATQQVVRENLELVAQESHTDDRFIFFFAGHGLTRHTPDGQKIGYVAAVESENDRWHTFLSINEIIDYSRFIAAKHILFIFDCCFSGLALTRGLAVTTAHDVRRWVRDCMTHKARQVLTAGLAEQQVGDLVDDGHSIFTHYLLEALEGGAAGDEGEITGARVMSYVADAVMKDTRSEQTPAYGDLQGTEPGGDFIFKRPDFHYFDIPANQEGGVNTGLYLMPGDRISILANGIISYDAWHHYTNPDGLFTTYKGYPLAHPTEAKPMIWFHPLAYQTNGDQLGIIGSLFGWIGEYSPETAFFIGEGTEIDIETEGFLHLAVNDAKGTYDDNHGEYQVAVRVLT